MIPSIVGLVAGLIVVSRAMQHEEMDVHATRTVSMVIRSFGPLLWPGILSALVTRRDRACRAMWLPTAWLLGTWLVDMMLLAYGESTEPGVTPAMLRLDPASVTAIGFGLSGLAGARADTPHVHLFLTAIVGCVAVVLPSHNLKRGSRADVVFGNVQRVVLVWCIALLISGVALTRACPA